MPKNQKRRPNPVIPAEAGIQFITDFVLESGPGLSHTKAGLHRHYDKRLMTFLYMNMTSRTWFFRSLALGWMALIFFLSSQPDVPAPEFFWQQDKLAHLLVFGVLGLLLAFSFAPPAEATWRRVLLITALVAAYGVTDELHQYFVPGREANIWDVLADGIGGFLAGAFLLWQGRNTRNPSISVRQSPP